MTKYTLTVVLNKDETAVLLQSHELRGLNFPGGHIEEGEDVLTASYRELEEETGITNAQIKLQELNYIQTVYDHSDITIHITYGVLDKDVTLVPEGDDTLIWAPLYGKFWKHSGRDHDGLAWVILQWTLERLKGGQN